MDIQWVILARAWRVSDNGTIDIAGTFDYMGANPPHYYGTLVVLAKVKADPTEIGKKVKVTLQLHRKGEGLVESLDVVYDIPDLSIWAKATPYISFDIDRFPFKKLGEYSFDILMDGEFKNREWFVLVDNKEMRR
jgi:hypothetical protein